MRLPYSRVLNIVESETGDERPLRNSGTHRIILLRIFHMEKENTVPNVAAEKHTLDAIEQSVKSLHVRIQYLLKEDNKHRKKLEDTFQDSIRLIERKVEQTQQHRKVDSINSLVEASHRARRASEQVSTESS